MNSIKKLNLIATILILSCVVAFHAYSEDKKCIQEVVVKNGPADMGFGAIWNYPGDIEPSVWFPVVPRALAIDSKGHIYVGDSVNYRVMKYDSKGKLLFEFKLQPPVKKIKPEISHIIQDIGIDKDDKVYVWNFFEDRVEIYYPDGKYQESVGSRDDRQKGIFAHIPKGKFGNYIYGIESYIPDKKYPGRILYSITVRDDKKIAAQCYGVEIASDEDGQIYNFDNNGNIYTFDALLNVIKINPFK